MRPIEEYLIELFLASSARSFATCSSDVISVLDIIMAVGAPLNTVPLIYPNVTYR